MTIKAQHVPQSLSQFLIEVTGNRMLAVKMRRPNLVPHLNISLRFQEIAFKFFTKFFCVNVSQRVCEFKIILEARRSQ